MKTANYVRLALLLTFVPGIVSPVPAQKSTGTVAAAPGQLSLMPVPASVELQTGRLAITNTFSVATKGHVDDRLRRSIARMTRRLAGRTVITLPLDLAADESSATLVVQCERGGSAIPSLNEDESYDLEITDKQARLIAPTVVGAIRGLETFLQLVQGDREGFFLPGIKIHDQPRFPWRGLLIDIARHYQPPEVLKRNLDAMAAVKLNVFHWHLTDDQGWRIEIKSLPKLTEVGAWRAPRTGRWGEFTKPTPDEPKTYGGYYTQDDMRELIQYAKERFVTILPEIDIPGHSMAAVASYPELSCTTDSVYQVNAGERFMFWPGNGTFYGVIDNNLCPANENVYQFLDKVFTEIAALFPFEYIHMGGDECFKGFWEKSQAVKQLMQREGLKDMHEVQSYFVKRVEKIINSKGKKMMGWDEIIEGGLAPGASVMSWQGMKGGIAAAKSGHAVVMSPNDYVYVDLYQGDPVAEPVTYSMLRLNKTYQFDPLPPGVDSTLILGGQCNLWSERLYTMRQAQYMLWPRGLATAEAVWSQASKKDWKSFVRRVEHQFDRFDKAEIKYSRSMYDPIFTARKDSSSGKVQLQIVLSTEIEGLTIHYNFDETLPDNFYPAYTTPLSVPKDAANLKVVTYRGKQQVGKIITMPVAELKKRAGIK